MTKYRAIDPERCAQVDALRKDRSATQHSLRRREKREGLNEDDHAEIQVQRDHIKKLEGECKELIAVMEAALVQRVVEGAGVALTAHLTAETLDMDATAIEAKARKDMQASITGMKKAAKMRADASEQHRESGKIFPLVTEFALGESDQVAPGTVDELAAALDLPAETSAAASSDAPAAAPDDPKKCDVCKKEYKSALGVKRHKCKGPPTDSSTSAPAKRARTKKDQGAAATVAPGQTRLCQIGITPAASTSAKRARTEDDDTATGLAAAAAAPGQTRLWPRYKWHAPAAKPDESAATDDQSETHEIVHELQIRSAIDQPENQKKFARDRCARECPL